MKESYGSQTPVVLFKVDPGQYAPKGHAAQIRKQQWSYASERWHGSEVRSGCEGLLTYHASEAMRAEEPSTATTAIKDSRRDVDSIF